MPMTLFESGQAVLIGLCWTTGHLGMTKALTMYDATVVLPVNCTRLIWAAIIGLLIFQEWPDFWTFVGSLLIVTAIIYLSQFEARRPSTTR